MKRTHIVIGTSAAGIGVLPKLRQLDPDAQIICISDEAEPPYNKCLLADWAAGKKTEHEIYTKTEEFFTKNDISLVRGKQVTSLVPSSKSIVLADGSSYRYDTLFLGVGTAPIVPSCMQSPALQGLFLFHRMHDVAGMLNFLESRSVRRAAIVGAGLSGLECADALLAHGIELFVIDKAEQVLPRQINQEASTFIEQSMQAHGISLYKEQTLTGINSTQGFVSEVVLTDGTTLDVQMVVFALGAKPRLELARQAGIACDQGALVIDENMQTSVADIYAGGDCVLVRDQLSDTYIQSCTWPDAMMQGMIAAHAMAGQPKKYPGTTILISSAFFGSKFAACGPVACPPAGLEVVATATKDNYRLFLLGQGLLKGFLMIGTLKHMPLVRRALMTKQPMDINTLLSQE